MNSYKLFSAGVLHDSVPERREGEAGRRREREEGKDPKGVQPRSACGASLRVDGRALAARRQQALVRAIVGEIAIATATERGREGGCVSCHVVLGVACVMSWILFLGFCYTIQHKMIEIA